MLFSFGSNGSGQLGLGHRDDASNPVICLDLQDPKRKRNPVTCIAAGGNHTLLLFPSGEVYSAGDNSDGRCGHPPSRGDGYRDKESAFRKIDHPPGSDGGPLGVKFISATWEASTFVTKDNIVLTCGSGSRGELGQGESMTSLHSLGRIGDFPPPRTYIVDLSASMGHTVAVISNGDVYGWGNGRKGQLGEPSSICWKPRKITGIHFKAVRAVCGRDFTYIIGAPGEGTHVVLGSDKWSIQTGAPQSLPLWKEVGASWGDIYVLLQDSTILAWGRNDHGQLPPKDLPAIKRIGVGSEHVLAETETGSVLAWGWGEHGNCGTPKENDQESKAWNNIPTAGKVTHLAGGCATSWIETLES